MGYIENLTSSFPFGLRCDDGYIDYNGVPGKLSG
jgi:hypothetical protein